MIEITETWDTVDRWWTDAPQRRQYAVLRSGAVDRDVRVCVGYDETTQTWFLIEEPPETRQVETP